MSHTYRDHGFRDFDNAVVVDVETTGLDPERDRIVSLMCLKGSIAELAAVGQTHLDSFKARLNPGMPIPREATRIHGIKDQDVASEQTFSDIAPQLRDFIGTLPLIGHNVSFDKAFLSAEFKRTGQKSLHRNKSYCTMKRLREHVGYSEGRWRNMSLAEAAELFGLSGRVQSHHDAEEDAKLVLQLAGGLYQLDNGIPPVSSLGREAAADLRPSRGAKDDLQRKRVLAIVLAIIAILILVSLMQQ